MSKATVAIAAFALGFFSSILFGLPQSEHQGSPSPKIDWPDLHTNVFDQGGIKGAKNGISLKEIGAVPFFNTLDHMPVFKRFTFSAIGQSLDGLNCEDCQFENANLRYGGGVVNLKGSIFSGTTELQLEGAAANTIALLEFLKAIPKGSLKYKLPIPNKPIIRKFPAAPTRETTPTPRPQKMDFTAPYIGPS